MKNIFIASLVSIFTIFAQETPLEISGFTQLTTQKQLAEFLRTLDASSDLLTTEILGKSSEGRDLFVMKFSNSVFGVDKEKIRVLIFAQQHGNEQSGKEASLLLARDLLKEESRYLFDKIDLAIIPQMNPDGSERNQRRNANNMDLNRNHLILTEPETIALHKFFDKYNFEVTMDVHEYYPLTNDWKNFGYIKKFDVQVGATTNPNVPETIRNFSNDKYFPFIKKYLNDAGYSFQNYILGGPPEKEFIRHSTYNINDGRQSLGILGTLSFIQEGINGEDHELDNIKRRAESQAKGMRGLIEFSFLNKDFILEMTNSVRTNISKIVNSSFAVQMDHEKNGRRLVFTLFSLSSENDTTLEVENYRPVVVPKKITNAPGGYLIPKSDDRLITWVLNHGLEFSSAEKEKLMSIEKYIINKIDSLDFEGDAVANPDIFVHDITSLDLSQYYFIPVAQMKGRMIIHALEPQSSLALHTYDMFKYLLNEGKEFRILRARGKN